MGSRWVRGRHRLIREILVYAVCAEVEGKLIIKGGCSGLEKKRREGRKYICLCAWE